MEKLAQNLVETLDGVHDTLSKLMVLYECNRKINYTSAVVRNELTHHFSQNIAFCFASTQYFDH